MEVQCCKSCGRIYSAANPGECPKCREREAEAFVLVTDALREEPGQTVQELSESTGVEEDLILKFVRDGKVASDSVKGEVPCGRCGKPAESLAVRLCSACLAELQKASAELANKEPEPGLASTARDRSSSTNKRSEESAKVHHVVTEKRK